jgi:hypothetical protein
MFDIAQHLAQANARRFDAGFLKLPAPELIGLIDYIIGICRTGVTLAQDDLDALKPFCGAADQLVAHPGPVAIRCEDYCRLVKIAEAISATDSDVDTTNTTPAPGWSHAPEEFTPTTRTWTTPPAADVFEEVR